MATKIFASHLITDELSYNLSRKYPFGRTFKWWTLGTFAIFMLLLTIFNLATNGFDKDFQYKSDPNGTEHADHWYNNYIFTWGSDNLTPKCQSIQIPIGYQFITTNLGFRYTVRNIFRFDPVTNTTTQSPSVAYHNNTLKDCDTSVMNIRLRKSDWSSPVETKEPAFSRWKWIESYATATARCTIPKDDGIYSLDLDVKYTPQVRDHSFLTSDNPESHAALWWGARLLNTYFAGIQHIMAGPLPDRNRKDPTHTWANIDFKGREDTANRSIHDANLFRLVYTFLGRDGLATEAFPLHGESPYNNLTYRFSRPLTEAFMWAKIFRSTILADLGNTEVPNLLTNETLLRYALDPKEDDFNRLPGGPLAPTSLRADRWMFATLPRPNKTFEVSNAVRLNETWDTFGHQTGPLLTRNATIHTQYICSVPGWRNPLAVGMFTLVANLTLFYSAWMMFKYAADRRVSWKDSESNWCEGCLEIRDTLWEDDGSRVSEEGQGFLMIDRSNERVRDLAQRKFASIRGRVTL